jgi:hypothetical protein
MHFEQVTYPTGTSNVNFLAPIPLFLKNYEDAEFHREIYEWGKRNLTEIEKRMGQELPGQIDESRKKLFPMHLKPESWIETEDVPIGSRFSVNPNNFLELEKWQIQELKKRILCDATEFMLSLGIEPRAIHITESWIQYYDPHAGRGHNQHNHTRWKDSEKQKYSFSGGYYLSDGDPSLDHPYSGAFCFHIRGMSHFMRPKPGMLMMWPSDIVHSVKPFYGKEHRCVINFNFYAEVDK